MSFFLALLDAVRRLVSQWSVSLYRLKAAATAISMRLHRVRRDDEKHYTDQFDSRDAMS